MKILAKTVRLIDDNYSTLLGFADDFNSPVMYIMLNMTNEPDEQDIKLGQGGIHIDAGALNLDGYDMVHDIRESEAGVIITLTPDAAEKAGIGQDIEITLENKLIDSIPLGETVLSFKRRLSSKKSES